MTALFAQGGQASGGDFLRGPFIPMLIMMGAVMYVMHRSQAKKVRQHEELLKTLKPGDKVLTSGGLMGTIVTVKEKSVSLRSADAKLEILKSAISDITERGSESKESSQS